MTWSGLAVEDADSRAPANLVQRREAWFKQASEAAYRAVLAITQNHEAQARSAIDELRFLKSVIHSGEPHQAGPEELVSVSPLSRQRMRLALDAIRDSDTVIRAWLQHNVAGLLAHGVPFDVQAWQRRIDHDLPERWNFESDLLLLNGHPPPELLEALHQRGQRRLLMLASASETVMSQPGADWCVSDDGTVLAAFVDSLAPPHPKICARLPVHAALAGADAVIEAERAALADVEQCILEAAAKLWSNHHTVQTFAAPGGA